MKILFGGEMPSGLEAEDEDEDELHEDAEIRLYYAVTSDDAAALRHMILDHEVKINYKFRGMNQLNKTILHLACEGGRYRCAKLLMDRGANPQSVDAWKQTPLMYSVCTGWDNLVELLLSYPDCDPNETCRNGKSALHFAVNNNDLTCVRILLESGAHPDIRDDFGCTPLWNAMTESGSLQTIKLLVEGGCDVDMKDNREKRTPLQVAILRGKRHAEEYAKYMIDMGAQLNTLDEFQHTPLMTTVLRYFRRGEKVSEEEFRILRHLLEGGSDVNVVARGRSWYQYCGTVLKMAIERGAVQLVELLLKYGANPDVNEDKVPTALHTAAVTNRLICGQLLAAAGCDLAIVGPVLVEGCLETMSVFHYCILQGKWEFAAMLIAAGYDLRHEAYAWTNKNVPCELMQNFDFLDWMHSFRSNPLRLSLLCERKTRECLTKPILAAIDKLQIPPGLKNALMLKTSDVF